MIRRYKEKSYENKKQERPRSSKAEGKTKNTENDKETK